MTEEKLALHDLAVRNLQRLAEYLESGLKPGTEFDMEHFYGSDSGEWYGNCGSVGCAVGHGPYAGIPKSGDETWVTYAYRVFGIHLDSGEWTWLFSDLWADITEFSDHLSTAKRIHAFLDAGNKVPWGDEDDGIQAMLDAVFHKYEL